MIYCIAGSSITFMSNEDIILPMYPEEHKDPKGIKTIKIGGTAYSSTEYLPIISGIKIKEKIKEDDLIILSWGEVDCRYYATIQAIKDKNPFYSLDEALSRYYNFLKYMKKIHPNLAMIHLVPQMIDSLPENLGHCDRGIRNSFIKYFNRRLNWFCDELNIFPIRLWDVIVRKDDWGDPSYYMNDMIHLSHKTRRIVLRILKKGKKYDICDW